MIKNFKINKNILPLLITSTLILSTSGCKKEKNIVNENKDIELSKKIEQYKNYNFSKINMKYYEFNSLDNTTLYDFSNLIDINKDTETYFWNYSYPSETYKLILKEEDNKINLYDNNTNTLLLEDFVSMSEPIYLWDYNQYVVEIHLKNKKYLAYTDDIKNPILTNYDSISNSNIIDMEVLANYNNVNNGLDEKGFIYEVIKEHHKYLIDASNFRKILFYDYDSIKEPILLNIENNKKAIEIIKNNKKYLIDYDNSKNILLTDYDSISEEFQLFLYDTYVREIVKNNKKYLVDSNDFSKIYLKDYKDIYYTNDDYDVIKVVYNDSVKFYNYTDFYENIIKSNILYDNTDNISFDIIYSDYLVTDKVDDIKKKVLK